MPGPRILILTSRTGGGHGRVAQALREHFRALEPGCEIIEVDGLAQTDLGLRIDPARAFLTLTTVLISLYNLGYRATNRAGAVEVMRAAIRLVYGRSLAGVIQEHAPDLIVSTHHFLSPGTVAADPDSVAPFVMVVSDLGQPHRLWFDLKLHTVYVPSDDMVGYAEGCLAESASRPRIEMWGFPVDLQGAGVNTGERTNQLLVMGGGAGTGAIDRLVYTLSAGLPEHRIVVVCGHNTALQRKIAAWGRRNVDVHGFVNNVPELMAASDLVITKAGPVTIMEAVAARRPLIITSWVGMQERDNIDFVVKQGLGLYCGEPRKLSGAVRIIYDRYADFSAAGPAEVEHGPDRIAASILDIWRNTVAGKSARAVVSSGMADARDDIADTYEVELKLQPRDAASLDAVWEMDRIGSFEVLSRHRLKLRNRYYDSPDHALDRAGGNLRWRTIAESDQAELTYKGPSQVRGGVFRRLEITAMLPSDVDPLSVDPIPAPLALARRVTANLRPMELVLENDRRGMRLTDGDATVEVDLDVTTMPGTDYYDLEIEAEMVSGDPEVLADLEVALTSFGEVARSVKGKRARGWEYLRARNQSPNQ